QPPTTQEHANSTFLRSQSQRSAPLRTWVAALTLLFVIGLVYGRSISAPFFFDDDETVTYNPSIVCLWPPLGTAKQPGPLNPPHDHPTSGRPLLNLSFALNYQLSGLNPVGYHIFNFCLHGLSTWLVWLIIRRTLQLEYFAGRVAGAGDILAFLTALLWAIHP